MTIEESLEHIRALLDRFPGVHVVWVRPGADTIRFGMYVEYEDRLLDLAHCAQGTNLLLSVEPAFSLPGQEGLRYLLHVPRDPARIEALGTALVRVLTERQLLPEPAPGEPVGRPSQAV
jgi:hypothetical protein